MKIKEYKNKIVLAELDPNAAYIMLYHRGRIPASVIRNMQLTMGGPYVYLIPTDDVDKSIRFVEIPKKGLEE